MKTIASILSPGSATEKALAPWQRLGLKAMATRLSMRSKSHHLSIPKEILRKRAQSDGIAFVVENFGGVKRTLDVPWKKNLHHFGQHFHPPVRSMAGILTDSELPLCPVTFVPPEWSRLSYQSQQELQKLLSWPSLSRWDFNIFELHKLSNGVPLLLLGWAILGSPQSQQAMANSCGEDVELVREGYNFRDLYNIRQDTLCNYLRAVEGDYRSRNPYHNSTHASDVVQTLHVFIQRSGKEFSKNIELFSVLFAAVGHDVGHPGLNNAFQEHAGTELALRYNDNSVLENMHSSKTFMWLFGLGTAHDIDMNAKELMKDEVNKMKNMNILEGMTNEQISDVRELAIDAILQTDMSKHFTAIEDMKMLISEGVDLETKREHSGEILSFMLHLADISNPAKPAPMFIDWTDRILEEYFIQGDKEIEKGLPISPLCDRSKTERPQSQIGFIQYVIIPAYEVLGNFIPFVTSHVLPQIEQNLRFWQEEDSKIKH